MSDFTFGRKKAGTSNFSSPSLVSPHTPTLANPVRGFGLPTNNVIQTQTAESAEQQAVQAADERSKLLLALEQPSFGHHISRYALRRPQAELTMAEPGDKYEMEAPESTDKQAAQPAAERSKLSLALEQPSFGHHISRYALRRPQAKLTVGEPGDKYEQEADWMANQVMRMVVPDKLNTDSVQPVEDTLQRKCTACEQEFDKVQTKPSIQTATDGGFEAGDNIESQLNSSKGGGSPLAPDVRSFMEPRFGADFSGVRVHTGSNAVQMNRELEAQAFTHGSDVYFGVGKSAGNNELTAHELTHVVQQNSGIQAKSNTQAEILQRDCDPTLASCPPDQTTTPTPATPDQTPTPAPASGVPPIGGSTPDYSQMTWQQLLPRAYGAKITNIDLHTPGNKIDTWGIGEAPTLNYAPDKNIHTDPASAAPQGGVGGTSAADVLAAAENSALSGAQDAAISQIITARTKIPDRPMGRSRNNNAGYDYNPDNDPAAKEYNQWIKFARPTGVNASDWNWQVFKRIQELEGQEGRFTTFDKTLSVGPGFSTSGLQTQQVIGKTFNLLPDVKSVAFAAGLTVDANGGMTVVDTDKKWILDSQNAAAYLQTDVSLLSLLVNISQGVQPIDASDGAVAPEEQGKQRQALLDAEWQQFLSGTLANVTSLVQSWSLDSAVLAVHAKHAQPGNFPFTFWNAQNSPDLDRMVAAIYNKVGESAKYICTGKYAQYYGSSNGSGD